MPTQLFLIDWLLTNGLRLLAIIAIAWIGLAVLRSSVRGLLKRAVAKHAARLSDDEKNRAATIARVINRTVSTVVIAIVLMMVLSEFGVNIGPLIAGAGIIGVAIGFGAQSLVRDCVSGLFILIEDQYRVGDVVKIDALIGEVEDMTLRRTVLRDADGAIHQVANGDIKKTANYSRDSARVNVELPIAHGTEVDRIIALVNAVGTALAEDPDFKKAIKKTPSFERVESISGSGYIAIVAAGAAPHDQWRVANALRRRLLDAMRQEGIKLG